MKPTAPQPLPPEIRVERRASDDVRYVLPRRPLGKWRWLAAAPIGIGAFGVTFAWGWFAPLLQMQAPEALIILGVVSVSFLFATTIVPLAISAAILWGYSTVEIRRGQLWAVERVGIFCWGHKRRLAQVRRLVVDTPHNANESSGPPATAPPSRFAAIRIETERGKPRLAAIGYPREWLVPLAHELARQVRDTAPDLSKPLTPGTAQVEVVEVVEVVDPSLPVQRFEQPFDSPIIKTQRPGSLTFEVPPDGIKRGAPGLFASACIWLAFMAVYTTIALFGQRQPQPGQDDAPIWVLALVLGFFWLIGIGLMLLALSIAHHRAAIVVADGRCLVVETGLFSEKKHVWEPGELRSVQVGPSGPGDDDKPVMELQFIPATGDKFGIFVTRDLAELQWLATHLRQALQLTPITSGAVMIAEVDLKPATSDAVFDEQPGGLTITVPRSPLRRRLLGYWITPIIGSVNLAGVTTVFVIATRNGPIPWGTFMPFAILSVLWLVNLVMFGVALHMTIRRAAIAVADGRLLVLQFGLLGKRRHEWPVEELTAIRAAAITTKLNFRPLTHLQIVPVSGKAVSLLTGDDLELAWIATQLRRATQLPAKTNSKREKQLPKAAAHPRSASDTQARSGGPV